MVISNSAASAHQGGSGVVTDPHVGDWEASNVDMVLIIIHNLLEDTTFYSNVIVYLEDCANTWIGNGLQNNGENVFHRAY